MADQKPKEIALYLPPHFVKEMKKAAIDLEMSPSKLVEVAVGEYIADRIPQAVAGSR